MSLETLILYGSAARGDQDADSDLDLFGISGDRNYNMSIKERVNLAIYPIDEALKMAEQGNLFMLHLVSEGKPIYDSQGHFAQLESKFIYKENYRRDIEDASDLGWALLECAFAAENYTLLNKRIAWCVRTILIAIAAEQRRPTFAAEALASLARDKDVYLLIKNKDNNQLSTKNLKRFKNFLISFAAKKPAWIADLAIQEYIKKFQDLENYIASRTISRLLSDLDDFGYYP